MSILIKKEIRRKEKKKKRKEKKKKRKRKEKEKKKKRKRKEKKIKLKKGDYHTLYKQIPRISVVRPIVGSDVVEVNLLRNDLLLLNNFNYSFVFLFFFNFILK